MDPFASDEICDMSSFVLRDSNPIRIPASLPLEFQKFNSILDKETARTRLMIVIRDRLFVQLKNRSDLIILLHGQPKFVYDARTDEGHLGNCFMSAFAIRFVLGSALLTHSKQ